MRVWILIAAVGCTRTYDGDYTARVATTIELTAPAPSTESFERTEEVTFVDGDMSRNELGLRRTECELVARKRGGYGLRLDGDQHCTRDGRTWTLREGGAPDEDRDELVIDLSWSVVSPTEAGTASETLRIAL